MRPVTIPRVAILIVAALLLVPLTVSAQDMYVPPKTEAAERVKDLYDVTTAIAIVVFIITQVALFYTIWRFRKNRNVPTGEEHRGHTTAEITWTVIPALILIFLGVLAVNTLQAIEIDPALNAGEDTVDIYAEAGRFAFTYYYPGEDGETDRDLFDDTLNVETGTTVRLTITSVDNQHAIWIPEFALKVDAYPNVENVVYFTAPEVGEYFVQCAEYCGNGHHLMHSSVNVVEEGTFEGRRAGVIEEAGADVPPGPEADVILAEEAGETPGSWSVDPAELVITLTNETDGIHLNALNPAENGAPHNLTVAGLVFTPGGPYPAGQAKWLNFTADMVGGLGEYQYWCAVPGHRGAGMEGTIRIELAG